MKKIFLILISLIFLVGCTIEQECFESNTFDDKALATTDIQIQSNKGEVLSSKSSSDTRENLLNIIQ